MTKRTPLEIKTHLLVLRCQIGDDQAFAELYTLFNKKTANILKSLLKNDDFLDLNQEVWLSIYHRIHSLEDPARFKYWSYQIARNRALDYFRQKGRLDYFDEIDEIKLANLPSPHSVVFDEVNHQRIAEARNHLPPKLNEVLELYYFQGMDYEEVALLIGCPIGTVKSRLYHAKHRIKSFLKS